MAYSGLVQVFLGKHSGNSNPLPIPFQSPSNPTPENKSPDEPHRVGIHPGFCRLKWAPPPKQQEEPAIRNQ